jgi:hypothetical protein
MLSRETIEFYRRMTPEERLKLTLQASREALPYLLLGPPEVVARRFERIRQEHDAGNRALLEGLARARDAEALRAQEQASLPPDSVK